MTYSFPNLEPVCCSMSSFNCYFLSCIQVSQETNKMVSDIPISFRIFQFVVTHIVKGFSVVKEAGFFFFLIPCFFYEPAHVGNLISGSSAFSKSSLSIWKCAAQNSKVKKKQYNRSLLTHLTTTISICCAFPVCLWCLYRYKQIHIYIDLLYVGESEGNHSMSFQNVPL